MKTTTPLFRITSRLALVAGFLAFVFRAAAEPQENPNAKPVPVRLAPVTYSTEAVPIEVPGVLARKAEADLSFKIGGVVETVLVRVGDSVKQGQVLARLRQDEIEAQVAQARSALEKSRRDLARVERLQVEAVATLENLQDARTAVDVAQAQLRIAEFNRRYAEIVAPADGRVLRRLAEPDELVAPGRAILGFAADAEGWLVRVNVATRDAARLRVGDAAELPGAQGRVSQISDATDPATHTVPVEIALSCAPTDARSGSVASVTLRPQPVAARPVVPANALIEGAGNSATVYVVEDGTTLARRTTVEVEELSGESAFLRSELPRSAQLVVQGAEFLRDGSTVIVAQR